jgi:rhodanese-related sulfurtransferase
VVGVIPTTRRYFYSSLPLFFEVFDMENNFPKLNVTVTKSAINGQVYDVLTYEEYSKNIKNYKDRNDIAISEEYEGKHIILPYLGAYNNDPIQPGIYNAGIVDFIKYPDKTNIDKYEQTDKNTVTMSNSDQIKTIIESAEASNKLDEPFITSPENITIIRINEDDQPEMKCLKMAINSKHIDLDKYAGRFKDNYPNDKRQLKNSSATLNIIKRYCENCDMEAILTIRDASDNVPNPMNREISVSLTNPNMNTDIEFMNPPSSSDYTDDEEDD